MAMSIDGKVTGEFLSASGLEKMSEIYYEVNRNLHGDAYACGRITMQQSFCGNESPEISQYSPSDAKDFISEEKSGFYAVAFDPHGRLNWKSNHIFDQDHDPGYDHAEIIEIVTAQCDSRYLSYLKSLGISYLICGEDKLDIKLALEKLYKKFGIHKLLLEGGSVLDGAFMNENLVDELSLVISPLIANTSDKPLFEESIISRYHLAKVEQFGDFLYLDYIK